MGIYVHRDKSIKTPSISQSTENSAVIKQIESEKHFQSFKQDLLRNQLPFFPICTIELKKNFIVKVEEYKDILRKELKNNGKDENYSARVLMFFQIKCKAIEGYFCYLNDLTSLQKVHLAKVMALKETAAGTCAEMEIKTVYYKHAKGSYQLQGYQELLAAIEMGMEVMEEFVDRQYEENLFRLKAMYQDLFDSKVVDEDIYLATVQ